MVNHLFCPSGTHLAEMLIFMSCESLLWGKIFLWHKVSALSGLRQEEIQKATGEENMVPLHWQALLTSFCPYTPTNWHVVANTG